MKTANPFDQRFPTFDDKGPREEQQDSCVSLRSATHSTALVVVSDGVGGKSGGRIASHKVTELAEVLWKERGGLFPDPKADLSALCRVVHQQINEAGRKQDISPRATIVALYLTPTSAHWVHSGDSRLYHFRAGRFLARTEDHSVVQVLVKQGLAKESEMGTHPDQGTLLQSLGGEDYKEPTHGSAEITPEDGFLLCTDGFWERTAPHEMAVLLSTPAADAPRVLKHAILRAIQRNGPKGDNVTAALALPATPVGAPLSSLATTVIKALILTCGVIAVAGTVWLLNSKEPAPVKEGDKRGRLVPDIINGSVVVPAPDNGKKPQQPQPVPFLGHAPGTTPAMRPPTEAPGPIFRQPPQQPGTPPPPNLSELPEDFIGPPSPAPPPKEVIQPAQPAQSGTGKVEPPITTPQPPPKKDEPKPNAQLPLDALLPFPPSLPPGLPP